jgi:tetratricopeptide (TPR) repeat protein
VASECFFEQPGAMWRLHRELYGVLRDFYRQDPVQWCPDAVVRQGRRRDVGDERQKGGVPDEATGAALERQVLASDDPEDLFMLGTQYLDDKRYWSAMRIFSRVIQLNPSDAEAYQQRAMAASQLGDYAAALTDAKEALRLDGDDVTGYLARGAAYVGLRQYERARKDLDRVLREQGNDAEAYYLRGLAWAGLEKLRKAVSDLSWSIILRPHFADAYYHRAQAYRQLGSAAEADADLETALQLDPRVGWRT